MSWCPQCNTEYDAAVGFCSDCGLPLTHDAPFEAAPVQVYHGTNANDARIVEATLRGEGIEAFMGAENITLPQAGINVNEDIAGELDVFVAACDAESALEIVNEPQFTDEELSEAATGIIGE